MAVEMSPNVRGFVRGLEGALGLDGLEFDELGCMTLGFGDELAVTLRLDDSRPDRLRAVATLGEPADGDARWGALLRANQGLGQMGASICVLSDGAAVAMQQTLAVDLARPEVAVEDFEAFVSAAEYWRKALRNVAPNGEADDASAFANLGQRV
jgi:hypothetical protein